VCCTGTFDLTHAGHVLFFEDCKKHGDIFVVGIGKDSLIKAYKGDLRPILNEHVRLKTVDSLKPVDYAYLMSGEWNNEDPHPFTLGTLFDKLKPNVYAVNSDVKDIDKRKKLTDLYGVQLVVLDRWCPKDFENISTSKIIETIKRL